MASLPDYLAGDGDLGSWEPTQLFAGESDIVTDGCECAADIAIYQVVAKNADGKLVPHDPSKEASVDTGVIVGESKAVGIAAQPAKAGESVPYYIGGVFNHEALGFAASLDTLVKRQRVFEGTNLHVTSLY